MLLKKLRILVVFQLPNEENTLEPQSYLQYDDWEDEKDVVNALKKLGHEVHLVGLKTNIKELIHHTEKIKPNLIFNLCETFKDDRKHEANIAGVCELLHIPYTGASAFSLHLCQDKAIQKQLLAYKQEIKTPGFVRISKEEKFFSLNHLNFPLIVKPLNLEASEGISQSSYVSNKKQCVKRIKYIQNKLNSDVILEEYVDGTDIYLAIIGEKKKTPLVIGEPVKLIFSNYPPHKKTIATYKSKWDNSYRKKWGIKTRVMKTSKLTEKIKELSLQTFKKLNLSGYVRFDMRLSEKGECFFLEANPNPSIGKNDDFSKSIRAKGMSYPDIIKEIIQASL